MSGFFNPQDYKTVHAWGGDSDSWGPPVPRLVEGKSADEVTLGIAVFFLDPLVYVCGFSRIDIALGAAIHPGGPGVPQYHATVVLQRRMDPNGETAEGENGGTE